MDLRLVQYLREAEDLFAGPSGDDLTNRRAEKERLKAERQKEARVKVDELLQEDDVPLSIIKELHEDNLAPNHQINFSLKDWISILVDMEAEEPGMLARLQHVEEGVRGAVMTLDSHTPPEMIARARRRGGR